MSVASSIGIRTLRSPPRSRHGAAVLRPLARIRKAWQEQPIAACAFLLSIISLGVSAGSLYTSRQSFWQTLTQYAEERALVLTGQFGDGTNSLSVKPADANFNFLGGSLELPSSIHYGSLDIQENGQVRGMATVDSELNSYIFKKRPPIPGYYSIVELGVPVLVFSDYTTKGRRYHDASLYQLKYQGILKEEENRPVGTHFSGFAFVTHFNSINELPNLDELLQSAMAQIEKAR
jgi:hypothetical protein